MTTDTQVAALRSTIADRRRKQDILVSQIGMAERFGGGATVDELERATGWPHQTVSALVSGLWHRSKPVVRDTGERRKTRHGREAIVWGIARERSL